MKLSKIFLSIFIDKFINETTIIDGYDTDRHSYLKYKDFKICADGIFLKDPFKGARELHDAIFTSVETANNINYEGVERDNKIISSYLVNIIAVLTKAAFKKTIDDMAKKINKDFDGGIIIIEINNPIKMDLTEHQN